MSIPALRQPKKIHVEVKDLPAYTEPQNYLIVTLKDGTKLVVSSDAYHGMLTAGDLNRCVFCETEMVRDVICKERHKTSENHRKILESYPHTDEFKENLIRKGCVRKGLRKTYETIDVLCKRIWLEKELNGANYYCTICNVVVMSQFLHKHITTDSHIKELQMALGRALAYKPSSST